MSQFWHILVQTTFFHPLQSDFLNLEIVFKVGSLCRELAGESNATLTAPHINDLRICFNCEGP